MRRRGIVAWRASAATLLVAAASFGQGNAATVQVDARTPAVASADAEAARHIVELGIFGGAMFPSPDHALYYRLPREEFDSPAPDIGFRAAVLPFGHVGVEVEGAAMPTKTESGQGAGLWAARAHLIAGYPLAGFTPFVLVGAGALGGGANSHGTDTDPAIHFGAGAQVAIDDFLGLRLDLRDTMSQKANASQGTQTHSPEILLGLVFGIGPGKSAPPAPAAEADADGDGVPDSADKCPKEPAKTADGCPVVDTDGDGVVDAKDACPTEAGPSPCGCPWHDADGDKVIDELDKCPNVAGPIEGCPDPDPDHDGIVGDADKCPNEPETKNGFEDADGCPDTLPERVKKFAGVVKGIEFDKGKETIRPVSGPVLDDAVSVLKEYPSLKIEISGHTDSDGDHDKNVALSQKRADAVKAYIAAKGIDASRVQTRGAGPDMPIADNKTPDGKQKNRRIEFKVLSQEVKP
jgi:outer membrane protein OmpA-like peptidoglycan-associated protein